MSEGAAFALIMVLTLPLSIAFAWLPWRLLRQRRLNPTNHAPKPGNDVEKGSV